METNGGSASSAVAAVGGDVAAVRARDPFELAAPLAALSREDLELMSSGEAEVVVAATQRLSNALAAVQTAAVATFAVRADEDLERYREQRRADVQERRATAEAAGREFTERWHPIPGEGGYAAASLAPLLRISPRTMATRVRRAQRMDHEMPATWEAARAGDIEPYRADAVVQAGELLEVEDLTEYEARVYAEDVTDLSTGALRRRARRAAVATDRDAVEEVAERAVARRGVTCGPDRDVPGLTRWCLSLPTETSARVWAAVDELGREYHRACRAVGNTDITLTQARADALVDLVLGNATVETTLELVVPVAAMSDGAPGTGGTPCTSGTPAAGGTPTCGVYESAVRRSPAEVLRGRGTTDEVVLSWVSGHDLHTASALEAEYALQLTRPLEIDGNPHLSRWHDSSPTGQPPPGQAAPPRRPAGPTPPTRGPCTRSVSEPEHARRGTPAPRQTFWERRHHERTHHPRRDLRPARRPG